LKLIYSFLIHLIKLFLPLFAIGNNKLHEFINGRSKTFKSIKGKSLSNSSVLWIHSASLGEFEQCMPLIKMIKNNFKNFKIAVTFFSPSGYKAQKKFKLVDWVGYLPLDTSSRIKTLINFMNPQAVILIKNEYWPNLLFCLKEKKIPVISISSRFYNKQFFFRNWAYWFLKSIKTIQEFYTIDLNSKILLNNIGIKNVIVSGDTRMDRVLDIYKSKNNLNIIENFLDKKNCWIAGSTWDEDYQLLLNYINNKNSLKVIIAPHDCSDKSISSIQKIVQQPIAKWSTYSDKKDKSKKILIIDRIGFLKYAYSYAKWAYIGGGMGRKGLHNILEAAVFGLPIIIGKNYQKFPEAVDLVKEGGCFSVKNSAEFETVIKYISKEKNYTKIKTLNYEYIKKRDGATQKIYNGLKKHLIKPNI
tara:strand:+ start:7652 stop:8899 length:1248 start_codon:yes stop_codon:yes gene_type:complete